MRQDLNFGNNSFEFWIHQEDMQPSYGFSNDETLVKLAMQTQNMSVGLPHLPIHGGRQPDLPTEFTNFLYLSSNMTVYGQVCK